MTPRRLPLVVLLAAAVAAAAGAAAPAAEGARPLQTSFLDPAKFGSPLHQAASFKRARAAGATRVRLTLHWVSVAPPGAVKPPGFNASRWDDPAYNWWWFDDQVRLARANGLDPFVTLTIAPMWASPSRNSNIDRPSHDELAAFAHAAATRYNGKQTVHGKELPRIRYWQVWNEPNRDYFLMPQYEGANIVAADWYREMVRRMGAAVRGVDATNRVIAGGLAPLARRNKPAPLAFMRALLCVSPNLKRTCDLRGNPLQFDVWAHHPYTLGGPTRKNPNPDNVMISGLPALQKVLRAAIRLGHVRGRDGIPLWATEFGWDTNPPDPQALPAGLHARWTAEALFRMWRAGVHSVTWWRIQDDPLSVSRYQSGFFMASGKRKLSFQAYRFPLVAFRTKRGVRVWGRTPHGQRGQVQLFVRSGKKWRPLGKVTTSVHGVFAKTFGAPYRRGAVKGRFRGESTLVFSLKPVPDRRVEPFGCGKPVPC